MVASRRYGENQAALKTKQVISLGLLKKAVQQGRRGFGARSVHEVREGERCEERQVCEREARQSLDLPARSRYGEGRERRWLVCRSLCEG